MKKKKILIINGPNLNLLNLRDSSIYGKQTLEQIEKNCNILAKEIDLEILFKQSNHEGEIVTPTVGRSSIDYKTIKKTKWGDTLKHELL